MKSKFFILFGIFVFLLSPMVRATIDTEIGAIEYLEDTERVSKISFDYTFSSDENDSIEYLIGVDCPTALMPRLESNIIQIGSNDPVIKSYDSTVIMKNVESQNCFAFIEIVSPIKKVIKKTFLIITDPIVQFRIKLNKKVFSVGEQVEIDYESSVENPSIEARLIYPNKKEELIRLPGLIKVEQVGTYDLDIVVSKEGYQVTKVREQFGVIGENVNISSETNEMGESVTGDLDKGRDISWENYKTLYLILSVLVGIVVVVLIVFFIFKKRRKINKIYYSG